MTDGQRVQLCGSSMQRRRIVFVVSAITVIVPVCERSACGWVHVLSEGHTQKLPIVRNLPLVDGGRAGVQCGAGASRYTHCPIGEVRCDVPKACRAVRTNGGGCERGGEAAVSEGPPAWSAGRRARGGPRWARTRRCCVIWMPRVTTGSVVSLHTTARELSLAWGVCGQVEAMRRMLRFLYTDCFDGLTSAPASASAPERGSATSSRSSRCGDRSSHGQSSAKLPLDAPGPLMRRHCASGCLAMTV